VTDRRTLSPDRLAALEEERDFLLRSLSDLEAEFEAGDMEAADFEELRADYTVRAADVIRAIDDQQTAMRAAAPSRSKGRVAAWFVGVVVFAVAAGWLLGQALGERGVNDQLTGSIDLTPREQFLECQFLDQSGAINEANECYTELLEVAPENVEALAYKGWLLERTAGSAEQLGADDEAAELRASARLLLEQAVAVDPGYPDARAFRVIISNSEGDREAACAEYQIFIDLDPPPFMQELVDQIAPCASN
jgi:tetratricopeptide (TPR) repeat protein